MAKRKATRAATGRKVAGLVGALSEALLADEAQARAGMEQLFAAAAAQARPRLAGLVKVQGVQGMVGHGAVEEFSQVLADVSIRCLGYAQALWRTAAGRALLSVKAELEAIELNLGPRYDGLAAAAVDEVELLVDPWMDVLQPVWIRDVALALVNFDELVVDDWRAAAAGQEPLELIDRRMFSVEPVRLPGHSGMGRWWAPFQACYAAAKAQEFVMVNGCRVQSMRAFNSHGIEIRDGR